MYAADDDDEDEGEMRKSKHLTVLEEEESSNQSSKKSEQEEVDDDDELASIVADPPSDSNSRESNTKLKFSLSLIQTKKIQNEPKKPKKVEESDQELDTDKEEEIEKDEIENEDKKDVEKKLRKEGFFEDEAELSGSEADSDENYDGDSNDDNSIVCSGDEDNLPSDSELKEQLGKIYLKDQLDEDKRQLRMFKEMYLSDGELHSKNSRKKNFRWKHLDGKNPHKPCTIEHIHKKE